MSSEAADPSIGIETVAVSPPTLVFIGPTASGKSAVVERLITAGVIRLHPTWTTRPMRNDEARARDHVFVDVNEFVQAEEAGRFFETVSMFGLPYRYGMPRFEPSFVGPVDAIMIRASLVERLFAHLDNVVIYQIESSIDDSLDRIERRKDNPDVRAARSAGLEEELELGRRLADRVFVNEGSIAGLGDRVAQSVRQDTDSPHRKLSDPLAHPSVVRPHFVGAKETGHSVLVVLTVSLLVVVIGSAVAIAVWFVIALNSWGSNK